jgi:hypothetical protein
MRLSHKTFHKSFPLQIHSASQYRPHLCLHPQENLSPLRTSLSFHALSSGISVIGLLSRRTLKAFLNLTAKQLPCVGKCELHKGRMSLCYSSKMRGAMLSMVTEQARYAESLDLFGFNLHPLGKRRGHGVKLILSLRSTTNARCGYASRNFGSAR